MRAIRWLACIIIILCAGCSVMKRLDLSRLQMGMNKEQAVAALGKKPENVIGAKQYDDGVLEVVEFSSFANIYTTPDGAAPLEKYWLYFFNDSLVEWGKPAVWQDEVNRVYRTYHRRH